MDPILLNALTAPAITLLTDDAAAAALSVPSYTPRTQAVTITTLSGNDCWGLTKTAAWVEAVQQVVDAGGANASLAKMVLTMLSGPGFYASDPQVGTLLPQFVAMGNGTITTDDGNLAVGVRSYPLGAPVATADVTAARAILANWQTLEGYRTRLDTARQQIDAAETQLLDGANPTIQAWDDLGSE